MPHPNHTFCSNYIVTPTEGRDKQPETPFFARYLEGQKSLKVKTNLKAGATLKYPSDRDEWWD
jgi:hypothetical protein